MVTTRRNNGGAASSSSQSQELRFEATTSTKQRQSPSTAADDDDTSAIPAPTHSPYLPTFTEKALLAVYPTTLLLGSLFSHLSPTLRPPYNESTYSVAHQSFQPAASAPSYFARKRNVFNVYFVKVGWFWCTLAFFLFLVFVARGRLSSAGGPRGRPAGGRQDAFAAERRDADDRLRRRYQAVMRYALSTLFWISTTQWFFGPPLIDRGFALTGGVCLAAEAGKDDPREELHSRIADALTHAACTAAGGKWRGGYDISGHVFLLVLGSGMLWMEILPYLLPRVKGLGVGRVIRGWGGRVVRVAHELGAAELYLEDPGRAGGRPSQWSAKATATTLTLAVAVLSWWMLLMTAAFFHTWFEKLTGLLLAMSGLWVVYFVPRGVPAARELLGMPGF